LRTVRITVLLVNHNSDIVTE